MFYYELWNILWNWKREFTVKEFISTFVSPSPNKVLHDMAKKGLLENIGWGKYKVNSPEEYLAKRTAITEAYNLVKEARMKYAFTGPDAVFFWTKGGYQADRFFGFYPIHMKIRKTDLKKWIKFFISKGMRFHVNDKPVKETLFGLFYVLYTEDNFKSEYVEEYPVSSLKETIDFCNKNIYTYEPALELLDEMYSLKLKVRYKETKTNW